MDVRWDVGSRQGSTLACKGKGQRMAMEKTRNKTITEIKVKWDVANETNQ